MKLILIGASGAGKGTQASILKERYNIPHISTGDIFRSHIREKTKIGVMVKEILDNGKLVPDNVTLDIVKLRLAEEDCENGFILDGFPRNISQAESLEAIVGIDKAIYISVGDDVLVSRLSGRLNCKSCGAMYNTVSAAPKVANICDNCNHELFQRDDDKEEVVRSRVALFKELTMPLIHYYEEHDALIEVDGVGNVNDITSSILKKLEG